MSKPISVQQYEQGELFSSVYPEYDLEELPTWLRERIGDARVTGASKQTIVLPDGTKYQLNNRLNDLSGGEWLKFTNSVLSTWYPTNGAEAYAFDLRKIHPSPKPPQLMKEIIEFFTKESDGILDYFAGVGGALLGAALCGRNAVGIDLNQDYLNTYKLVAKKLALKEMSTICGNSPQILNDKETILSLNGNKLFSLILLDPPYANMMSKAKTGGDISRYGKEATPFTNNKYDLGNMRHEEWLLSLKSSIELSMPLLKRRGYLVIFIKDLQPTKKQTNLLHADIINMGNNIPELYYKGLRIWADQSAKLFPYGYPLSFVANQAHQYILIFRKEK